MAQERWTVLGFPGSPYSRKLLGALRYRRVPYRLIWTGLSGPPPGLKPPKVALLPTVYPPAADGAAPEPLTDTTPILRLLETARPDRALTPPDPALAFVDALIEDYADEWLTKAMFHYRWAHGRDAANAARMLAFWAEPSQPDAAARAIGESFSARQIGRLDVVGSTAATGPAIEASYLRAIEILDALIAERAFLFGARPAAADFALYGQLTQLVCVEPTPTAIADQAAPRLRPWVERVEDLSGLEPAEGDWMARGAAIARLQPLLNEIGRTYAPYLSANAAAEARGEEAFETVIDGLPWRQKVFSYQVKCRHALRDAHGALGAEAQVALAGPLEAAGCAALVG